jgi:hypothetical protein
VITLLETCGVTEISLDHDLGTGYDVLSWIEEAVAVRSFRPPNIHVHSVNPAARLRMLAAIGAIKRLARRASES